MNQTALTFACAAIVGTLSLKRYPFPDTNGLLQMVLFHKPYIFHALRWGWFILLFTTPGLFFSGLFSLLFIFTAKRGRQKTGQLPPYPAGTTEQLSVVIGECHHPRKPVPVEFPSWLNIPDRGLFTGMAIFGAIGSGKTTCCMRPYAQQILGFRAADRERRIGGMVLEVKGDFCYQIRNILTAVSRADDYIEISLVGEYCYNPLQNDLDAFTLAYSIASLLNNLYGKGKEPFWQQAYTNLVKFVILLHKVVDGYVTLFNVYECIINPAKLAMKIKKGEDAFAKIAASQATLQSHVVINSSDYLAHERLWEVKWEHRSGDLVTPVTEWLPEYLAQEGVPYTIEQPEPIEDADLLATRLGQFDAIKRWAVDDWGRIEPKLRTSIVEGVSVFLSMFDDNPQLKRIFCPAKECYDPVANRDGKFGKPLPSFAELIEGGKVVALNFPIATNPGVARAVGTFLKQDFQRAMLNRIPQMEKHPTQHFREALFLCDEYQAFATVGESDPTGDEKFFALSRQAKCIPIVATQSISSLKSTLPGESWRTLLQTFRTKIFLSLSDDFSAKTASDLCGREEQMSPNYSISESGQDVRVSTLTGRALAHKAGMTVNKNFSMTWRPVFEAKQFMELKNAEAIVLVYDGVNPLPPQRCYLKPHYLDPNISYFEQLDRNQI